MLVYPSGHIGLGTWGSGVVVVVVVVVTLVQTVSPASSTVQLVAVSSALGSASGGSLAATSRVCCHVTRARARSSESPKGLEIRLILQNFGVMEDLSSQLRLDF